MSAIFPTINMSKEEIIEVYEQMGTELKKSNEENTSLKKALDGMIKEMNNEFYWKNKYKQENERLKKQLKTKI